MPFTFIYGGASIPASLYQQLSEPLASLVVYNNSPVTFNVDDHPPGPLELDIAGIVPAFYAITIPLGGYTTFALLATSGSPLAGNSLNIQVYTQAEAAQGVIAPPLAAPFGPGGWGPGAVPNSLQPIHPTDQFLAWQAQQFLNALTGVMTGQVFTFANSVRVSGPGGEFRMLDEGGVGPAYSWYNLSNAPVGSESVRLFDYDVAVNNDVLAIGKLAHVDTVLATRINAIVGPDAQRLLNWTFIAPDAGLSIVDNPPANVENIQTLTNLPSNNVTAVLLRAEVDTNTAGNFAEVRPNTSDAQYSGKISAIGGVNTVGLMCCRVNPGTQNIRVHRVVATTSMTTILTVLAYAEPT